MKRLLMIMVVVFLTFSHGALFGGDHLENVTLTELISHTQMSSKDDRSVRMVWWLPEEFWVISMRNNPAMNQEYIEEFSAVISGYTIFLVLDGTISPLGTINYAPFEETMNNLVLSTENMVRHLPLPRNAISSDLKMTLDMFKPVFSNMMGSMGQNIQYAVFRGEQDESLFSVLDSTNFTITIHDEVFRFNLPLVCFLPQKWCNACEKQFQGDYNFCPYHGIELIIKKSGQ
ncbi:hypothetical protein QA601_00245 [Chitinispirillales bacterium ANBcel5]|uniref:hypothetical protein n=1 Tax=Cellulosispirillum alkaliphilum TaxID=3039283 RepID=UPI002A4E8641|nr:hypothetical protein [Chitinispirillales bacterium ANBcel5]